MKFKSGFPFVECRGTSSNSQLTYTTIKGEIVARAKVTPKNTRSEEQQLIRSYISAITKNWDVVTRAQRKAWEDYAKLHLLEKKKPNVSEGLSGYLRANVNRLILGLPLTAAAPVEAPPTALQRIVQVDGTNPDTLSFTVVHNLSVTAGHVLLVRLTPATATDAREPQAKDFRFVQGATAASTVALPASSGTVSFTPARYSIEDGRRYGVEVRVVRTADGVPSVPTYGDFVKVV